MGNPATLARRAANGAGVKVATALANKAIGYLRDIAAYDAEQVRLLQAQPLMFRSQAAVHSTFVPATTPDVSAAYKILEANPKRKGLIIQQTGANGGLLGLGEQPIIDTSTTPASYKGIFLAGDAGLGGGRWEGLVSGALWTGEVWARVLDPARFVVAFAITEVA